MSDREKSEGFGMGRYPQSQVGVERELPGVRPSGGTVVIACLEKQ